MKRCLTVAVVALLVAAPLGVSAPRTPAALTGQYLEARTCDIWTGPCFANAEMNLTGKNAVLAWKVQSGSHDRVRLDGLGVVAVVAARDTLGMKQSGKARAVLIVDSRANAAQRAALVSLARQQGGDLVGDVVRVTAAEFSFDICPCDAGGCARLQAGDARVETRCVHTGDKICGNESAFYPPLVRGVKVQPAVAVEHSYRGTGVGARWSDAGRRGAYLGTFEVR